MTVNFDSMPLGKPPAGFTAAKTGEGAEGQWIVREDPSAPRGRKVLAQIDADATNRRYPLCIYDEVSAKDVAVTVAFKPVSGKVDQGAGIIVRYKDKDNYYIARANALEDNVRLYRVVNGQRQQFAGIDTKAPESGKWHTLSLSVTGNRFVVSMNGKKLFEAEDNTFAEAGKVGLWTKADSVTYFDDLRIEK